MVEINHGMPFMVRFDSKGVSNFFMEFMESVFFLWNLWNQYFFYGIYGISIFFMES